MKFFDGGKKDGVFAMVQQDDILTVGVEQDGLWVKFGGLERHKHVCGGGRGGAGVGWVMVGVMPSKLVVDLRENDFEEVWEVVIIF